MTALSRRAALFAPLGLALAGVLPTPAPGIVALDPGKRIGMHVSGFQRIRWSDLDADDFGPQSGDVATSYDVLQPLLKPCPEVLHHVGGVVPSDLVVKPRSLGEQLPELVGRASLSRDEANERLKDAPRGVAGHPGEVRLEQRVNLFVGHVDPSSSHSVPDAEPAK